MIHDADIGDGRYDSAEAPGLELAIRGLGEMLDDHALLQVTETMFNGIYATLST